MTDILIEQVEDQPPKVSSSIDVEGTGPRKFPKGVVLGKDGKPCRSCTSFASWASMAKKQEVANPSSTTAAASSTTTAHAPPDCPPDVDALGTASWTLLHSLTANYPSSATPTQQSQMSQFLSLFSQLYPCWVCADDFRAWMKTKGNEPRLQGREPFGRWMCEAHNEVNRKLGKSSFDCGKWEERWRTGWKDGRCD